MSLGITSLQSAAYQVSTPVYEGPLDLLLQLIERAELDITKVSLAQVTDQYLEHIRKLTELAADEVSAFLVIAARLIQIKSEVLLPRPPLREPGEEDPGLALAGQLIEYRRYRVIADHLAFREAAGLQTYLHIAPTLKVEGTLDLSGLGLTDLVAAAISSLSQWEARSSLGTVFPPPRITMREKVNHIIDRLRQRSQLTFGSLLDRKRSRLDVIVTFLAVLEMVKRALIRASQEALFGDIELEAMDNLEGNELFESEFGE
jgi:segregation and condensation protein A